MKGKAGFYPSTQAARSVAPRGIHQPERLLSALDASDVVDHLLHHELGDGLTGDVRRDQDTRVVPKRVIEGQRLAIEDVEHRAGEPAAVERREQIGFDQVCAARDVDQIRSARQARKRTGVEDVRRRPRSAAEN